MHFHQKLALFQLFISTLIPLVFDLYLGSIDESFSPADQKAAMDILQNIKATGIHGIPAVEVMSPHEEKGDPRFSTNTDTNAIVNTPEQTSNNLGNTLGTSLYMPNSLGIGGVVGSFGGTSEAGIAKKRFSMASQHSFMSENDFGGANTYVDPMAISMDQGDETGSILSAGFENELRDSPRINNRHVNNNIQTGTTTATGTAAGRSMRAGVGSILRTNLARGSGAGGAGSSSDGKSNADNGKSKRDGTTEAVGVGGSISDWASKIDIAQ